MTLALIHHESSLGHTEPPGHPERAERIRAVHAALEDERFAHLHRVEARPADEALLRLAHPQRHIDRIRETIPACEVEGPEKGKVLVFGWGSTFGAITGACERLREKGVSVANTHIRHLWPLPGGIDELFSNYEKILVPELNMGQLARILRSEYPSHEIVSYSKVEGRPFTTTDVLQKIEEVVAQ